MYTVSPKKIPDVCGCNSNMCRWVLALFSIIVSRKVANWCYNSHRDRLMFLHYLAKLETWKLHLLTWMLCVALLTKTHRTRQYLYLVIDRLSVSTRSKINMYQTRHTAQSIQLSNMHTIGIMISATISCAMSIMGDFFSWNGKSLDSILRYFTAASQR